MAKQKKKVEPPRIPKPELVQGIIRLHPRGFGFLLPEGKRGPKEEIFIPKHLTLHAVDGDRVEVAVKPEISPKGKEGKVLSVLERGRTHLAGTVHQIDKEGRPLVYVPILGSDSRVALEEGEAKVGDRVVIEILSWGERGGVTAGRLKNVIGTIESPADDIKAAVEEYSLSRDFPEVVLDSLKNLGNKIKPSEKKGREDLTKLPTITIDPDTAKDFDDALSIEKRKDGTFYLAVHVADVSHYVRPGTAVDEEARRRSNSTYFPGTCIPMLPEVLSNELCSLKPNVNRLAATIHMEFSPEGELIRYRVSRSVIKSDHRFTYKEARKVLDGKKKSPFYDMLQDMRELALLLKAIRKGRGSIELSLPDLFVKVDENGVPLGVEWEEYDITHQLVEEFMLKANEVVATHIAELGKPLTYRIHESPDMEDIEEFVRLVRSFELNIPDQPTPQEIQEVINQAASTPFASFVVGSYIRSMKLAVYSSANIGHHGLALEHYCHFTSPIRRYPDLVVHRLLFGGEGDLEEVDRVADMASTQERVSAKAEQSVKLLKKLRLLNIAPPKKEFVAYVSRVKPFGFAFEVVEMGLEGFFGFEDLGDDYYFYDEKKRSLEGRRTKESYFVGREIAVALQEIDLIFLEAKWYLITDTPRSGEKKKKRRRR
jgi:ribonuclease R